MLSKDEVLMMKMWAIADEHKHRNDQRFDAQTVIKLAESHEELRKILEDHIVDNGRTPK